MRLAFVIFILCYQSAFSQKTGEVDYPYLGIKFTIPPQWKGGESGDGFLIISDTQPGLIFMVPHDVNDLDILKREAEAGLHLIDRRLRHDCQPYSSLPPAAPRGD